MRCILRTIDIVRIGSAIWCGRWDLNPRTPTGQAPQACASKTHQPSRVSLTWLGNSSRRKQRTPAHQPEPLPQRTKRGQGPNWLSPAPTLHQKTGKCLIQARPSIVQTRTLLIISDQEKQDHPWPRDAGRQDAYEPAAATAGDDPANTATRECKEDTETQDGNATGGAA